MFCTVWDLPIAAPSRMHCRQSLEGRSHFLPPAVKYSVRPEIIWDSFQGLALFKYAGNNGQGIKWSTASHSEGSRGFESTARVSHNTIDSWSAVYICSAVISYWWGEPMKSCQTTEIQYYIRSVQFGNIQYTFILFSKHASFFLQSAEWHFHIPLLAFCISSENLNLIQS